MSRRALGLACAAALLAPSAAAAQQPLEPLGSQLRLTTQGLDGDKAVDASEPSVAYNSRDGEYLLVWSGQDGPAPEELEIYGRRLDASGKPLADVLRLTSVGVPDDGRVEAVEPSVAYDAVHNRYAVAYSANANDAIFQIFVRLFDAKGAPVSVVKQVSDAGQANGARNPDIVHHPADDRFFVAWQQGPELRLELSQIFARLVNADTGDLEPETPSRISNEEQPLQGATQPTVVVRPGQPAFAVAWLAAAQTAQTPSTEPEQPPREVEVWGRLVSRQAEVAQDAPQQRITNFGPDETSGFDPSSPDLVANPDRGELLLAFAAPDAIEGQEIYVQRLRDDLSTLGAERRISSAGPTGSRSGYDARQPSAAYQRAWRSYLVTWRGKDDGRPGLNDAEDEVMGQVLDGLGNETGADDFVISRMGLDGTGNSAPADEPGAVAANERTGEWLAVWSADDARPPTADDEFEIWGRRIGPNFDRDYDGSPVPADCDDLDPGRHPGLVDQPDNGIDEDCSGKDNLDGDRDGWERPRDCNDRDPFIHPRRRDIPGNGIDEDCSGRDSLLPTAAKVRTTWVFGATTTVARLFVQRVRRGMRVTLRCSGPGCPRRLVRGRTVRVRRAGTLRLIGHFRGVRLQPGATVEVSIRDPRAIGVLERFRIRSGSPPAQSTRCLHPGRRRPARCRD